MFHYADSNCDKFVVLTISSQVKSRQNCKVHTPVGMIGWFGKLMQNHVARAFTIICYFWSPQKHQKCINHGPHKTFLMEVGGKFWEMVQMIFIFDVCTSNTYSSNTWYKKQSQISLFYPENFHSMVTFFAAVFWEKSWQMFQIFFPQHMLMSASAHISIRHILKLQQ